MAQKQKMREEQKKLQEAKAKAAGKGPMGTNVILHFEFNHRNINLWFIFGELVLLI